MEIIYASVIYFILMTETFTCTCATGQVSKLTEANTNFAVDLYHALRHDSDQGENFFFSPYSISTVMAMVYEGSGSRTRTEIENALQFNQVSDSAGAFRRLNAILNRGNSTYTLDVANRMYHDDNYHFREEYLEKIRNFFDSDVIASDFRGHTEQVRQQINEWVSLKTRGKIQNLIQELDPDTVMALINALYFKGDWENPFNQKNTYSGSFYVSPTESINVQMMSQSAGESEFPFKIGYNEAAGGFQILEMPYSQGDLSMFILLPGSMWSRYQYSLAELETLENGLTYEIIRTMSVNLREELRLRIIVPKFKFRQRINLKTILQEMGIHDLFKVGVSDLSGMGSGLYVSNALQEAVVEVNEKGSEAAASTYVGIVPMSMPRMFTANHPFLFLIRDNQSGSILFMGRVVRPE